MNRARWRVGVLEWGKSDHPRLRARINPDKNLIEYHWLWRALSEMKDTNSLKDIYICMLWLENFFGWKFFATSLEFSNQRRNFQPTKKILTS